MEMLKAAHEKASKELTHCKYPKISFEQNLRRQSESTVVGRHMYDVGHILEFRRKNLSNESKSQEETVMPADVVGDFEAKYPHEISVKRGDHVQVNKTYLTHT